VAGIDFIAAGNIDPDNKLLGLEAEDGGSYRKLVLNPDGLLVGFTSLGTSKGNLELTGALARKNIPESLCADLGRINFDFVRIEELPTVS
jgi:hypothetical protein